MNRASAVVDQGVFEVLPGRPWSRHRPVWPLLPVMSGAVDPAPVLLGVLFRWAPGQIWELLGGVDGRCG